MFINYSQNKSLYEDRNTLLPDNGQFFFSFLPLTDEDIQAVLIRNASEVMNPTDSC
jgi:hypothetical protein